MKIKIKVLRFVIIYFALGIFSLAINGTKAADIGVGVSPPVINLSAGQGEKVSGSFHYLNNTDEDQRISLEAVSFVPSGGLDSSPVFYDYSGQAISSPSKDWIKFEELQDSIVLSGGRKKINFSFNIPKEAESKKYYNTVFVTGSCIDNQNNVQDSGSKINYRIGTLVTLDVEKKYISDDKEEETNNMIWDVLSDPMLQPYFLGLGVLLLLSAIILIIIREKEMKRKKDLPDSSDKTNNKIKAGKAKKK